jgi:hypothetical protein
MLVPIGGYLLQHCHQNYYMCFEHHQFWSQRRLAYKLLVVDGSSFASGGKGVTSKMALNSPLSLFHLTSFFLIFCHHVTTSNFKRVRSLKRVLYLANLAFAIIILEALHFHLVTCPYRLGIIVLLNKSTYTSKLAIVSCDSCNRCYRTSSLWCYFAL